MPILAALEQRSSSGIVGPPRDPVVAEWLGMGARSASGMNVTPDTSMKVTAVFRAVTILSQTFGSLPIGVYRQTADNGRELDKSHPLYDVLVRKPNRWQTSFEWREMMSGHFALRGRCYSEIISSNGKAIAELVPLHPDRVRPFWAPDGKIVFAYSPLSGPERIILQSEMHYMHGLSTGPDGITPLSPIAENREAVGLALATEEHGARLFANGTRLGGVLKMAGHLKDDAARKEFMKSWNEAHSGVSNRGKTALLEQGLEWQAIGMTNEDAQYIDSRIHQIAEIARIFGIPPHKLYDLSRSTNNNIEHQGIEFVTDNIRPGAIRREEAMERDLLFGASAKTHSIMFDLDGLMRGDSAARAAYYASALQNGYKTRNQVRVMEGDNPDPDKNMNKYTVQLNLTTIDKVGIPQPQPAQQRSEP